MESTQLAHLIQTEGLPKIAALFERYEYQFEAAITRGTDLSAWRMRTAPGMVCFWRVGRTEAAPDPDPVALAAVESELAAVWDAMREPLPYVGENIERYNDLSRRLGELQHERARIKGLPAPHVSTGRQFGRYEEPVAPRAQREYPDQAVVCVNAPESERTTWLPMTEGDVPTILLMCPMEAPF